jgi:flagellin
MTMSVQTNVGAFAALQALNATNRDLLTTQNRINTGLKVAGAKDNGAVFNIAQQQRADKLAYDAVKAGLDRAKSMADVALAAGDALSDVFTQMREKAVAASDPSISATSRTAFNNEFVALRDQVTSIINNAVFDGANLLNGSATTFTFMANTAGTTTVALPGLDLRLLTSVTAAPAAPAPPAAVTTYTSAAMRLEAGTDLTNVDRAIDARERVAASLEFVNSQLARLGAAAKRVETHSAFVTKLQDAITAGIGNMVDADLARESASLQALQVKQQLGTQALSIANQAPQSILSLFR